MDTYAQLQEIRTYYRFLDVDVDRYHLGDSYQQVMLSARELDPSLLSADAQTWVNLHLLFTHGAGVVMSPVTQKTAEGLPIFYLKDIPPVADRRASDNRAAHLFRARRRRLCDRQRRHAGVRLSQRGAITSTLITMARTASPSAGSPRRSLFAWYFGDINILLSGYLTSESRIMLHRNIKDRVETIAPFLQLDGDPYVAVSEGRLYWIQDAYTTSEWFPYAKPEPDGGDINYIRNSVKVVIDAYNGTVSFYVTDAADPIIATYRRIFPSLFKPFDCDAPGSAKAHPLSRGPFHHSGASVPRLSHGRA